MRELTTHWRCPHCRTLHKKGRLEYSGGWAGNAMGLPSHADDCPKCSGTVSGRAIAAGAYDALPSSDLFGSLLGIAVTVAIFVWICGGGLGVVKSFSAGTGLGMLCLLLWVAVPFAIIMLGHRRML